MIGRKISVPGYGGYGYGYGPNSGSGQTSSKWAPGTKIYNDDYGDGVVVKVNRSEGGLLVQVQFESGTVKKFLPEYQKNKLQIIKD